MSRLRKLTIAGMRGILAPFTLDLLKDGKPASVVLFGGNGAGKSSITDAWEWLCSGQIGHLQREGARTSAWAHKDATADGSWVEAEFSDAALGTLRQRFVPTSATQPERSGAFDELEARHRHPSFVRFADITRFVYLSKSVRYDELSKLMGLGPQVSAQRALRRVQKQLGKELEGRERELSSAIARLDECATAAGATASDVPSIHAALDPKLRALGVIVDPTRQGLGAAVDAVKGKIAGDEQVRRAQDRRDLGEAAERLVSLGETRDALSAVVDAMSAFRDAERATADAALRELYEAGLVAVERSDDPALCPLCQQRAPESIALPLRAKLDAMAALKTALEDARLKIERARSTVASARSSIGSTVAVLARATVGNRALEEAMEALRASIDGLSNGLLDAEPVLGKRPERMNAESVEPLVRSVSDPAWDDTKAARDLVAARLRVLASESSDAAREELLQLDAQLGGIVVALDRLDDARRSHDRLKRVAEAFDRETDDYSRDCGADVTRRFDEISEDVQRYFAILEKSAPHLAKPSLAVREEKDRAVELEVLFHGEAARPASKYLSESQLNSIGLSVYLASVRRINDRFDVIVLDDVVNSLDAHKGPRLIEVLKQHFDDRQIVLLTHDEMWFDRLRDELPRWKCARLARSPGEATPRLIPTNTRVQQVLDSLDQADVLGAIRTLGPLVEDRIGQLCEQFEAAPKYLRDKKHTLAPLQQALIDRAKSKLGAGHNVTQLLEKVAASRPIRNYAMHSQDVSVGVSEEEVREVLADWKNLLAAIECPLERCGRSVKYEASTKDFRCGCGGVVLNKVSSPQHA